MSEVKNKKLLLILLTSVGLVLGTFSILMAFLFKADIKSFWVYFLTILGALLVFVGLFALYKLIHKKGKPLTVRQISLIGVMSSLSVILYYFVKFQLPFFPPWLDIQVSEIPALITGFAYGPYAGFMVLLVRFFIKLPTTMTAGVGELADLILSTILVLVSSIIYKKHRNLKGAIVGMCIAIFVSLIGACLVNWLILIPAYVHIAGYKMADLVFLLSYMPFEVTEENFMLSYIFVGVLPFNLVRYILVFIFTFGLYKVTHKLLNKLSKEKA